MAEFTRAERDDLIRRARVLDDRLLGRDGKPPLEGREAAPTREQYYLLLAEYADRLPRVPMSACPFTGEILKRSFDPWGLDGPWWMQDCEAAFEEPSAPPAFRVLLGALGLHGREPAETRDSVMPGPEVPYVVPRLLELPGMVAVVSTLPLVNGDTAYPIVYWSAEEIAPSQLHQPWLRQELWFQTDEGASAWLIANDVWDFELAPYVASGKLRWIAPGDATMTVAGGPGATVCPYIGLAGAREPAQLAAGERFPLPLPDGAPVSPFEGL